MSDEETRESLEADRSILAQREDFVHQCMREEGFNYYYEPADIQLQGPVGFEHPYGSVEWSRQYGIGVSTLIFSQDEVGPELIGGPQRIQPPDGSEDDPEELEFEALGDAGRAAYWKALYGSADPGDPDLSQGQRDGSCWGRSSAAFPGQWGLIDQKWGQERIDELRDRIKSSPEVLDMLRSGELCVREQGYSVTTRGAAAEQIEQQLQVLFEQHPEGPGDPDFDEALGDIQEDELRLARVFSDCGVGAQLEAPVRERVAIRLAYEMEILTPIED